MDMAFCRGCGKEIHSTATSCPQCGALQALAINSRGGQGVGRTIASVVVWILFFWIIPVMWLSFLGVVFKTIAPEEAEVIAQVLSSPMLFTSVVLTAVFSYLGKLPGTKTTNSQ